MQYLDKLASNCFFNVFHERKVGLCVGYTTSVVSFSNNLLFKACANQFKYFWPRFWFGYSLPCRKIATRQQQPAVKWYFCWIMHMLWSISCFASCWKLFNLDLGNKQHLRDTYPWNTFRVILVQFFFDINFIEHVDVLNVRVT